MSEYSPEMKKSPASEEARPHFAGIPAHIHEEAYRLLPHATYREAFDLIVPLYRKYCETHPDQKVILMGDSSGGGLSLAIAWSKDGLNRMTMLVVYTKNGGKVHGEDVRVRVNSEARNGFKEDGYAIYRDYAIKQADEVLKVKHDWSIFEHERADLGKVDWLYMLRKSLGSLLSLEKLVS